MKENNKGITLMTLSIMVILLIIISSTTTYYSITALQNAKLTKFETELKVMQAQVELWEKEETDIGSSVDGSDDGEILNDCLKKIFENDEDDEDKVNKAKKYYKYITQSEIKEKGIDGISGDYFVIIDTSVISNVKLLNYRVISINGVKHKGETYHTLIELEVAGLVASNSYYKQSQYAVARLDVNNKIYNSVQAAIDAAETDEATVTLLKKDITESIEIDENQNIILDTNGKTITNNGTNDTITNNGSLTIIGEGTINNENSDTYYAISNKGALSIDDGHILGTLGISNTGSGIVNINGGTVFASKIAISVSSLSSVSVNENGENNFVLTITDGIIIAKTEEATAESVAILIENATSTNNKLVNIRGGIIKAISTENNTKGIYSENNVNGKIKMTGGKIITEAKNECIGIYSITDNIQILGGEITSMSSESNAIGIYTDTADTNVTITIGTNDSSVSTITPVITGKTYAIKGNNLTTLNMYDGVLKHGTELEPVAGINTQQCSTGYSLNTSSTTDLDGYYITTLQQTN